MTVSINRGRVGKFDSIVIENELLRAVIVPELGGRIWELTDRRRNRQWIWHRPDVPLDRPSGDAVYDDVWAGGWEELFPNDAPGMFSGRSLPDHGEWWLLPWTVTEMEAAETGRIRLSANTSVVNASCTKEITVQSGIPEIVMSYRIISRESLPFDFLFKQHLPVDIHPECRLRLPGGMVEAVDPDFGNMIGRSGQFEWPGFQDKQRSIDMETIPVQSSGLREFVYVRDLPEPWCGVEDTRTGASIMMRFDAAMLPYVWLFLSYGGWRNLYTAVLEPCSNMPKDLAEAVRLGQAAQLGPGELFETAVTVRLD